MADSKPYASLSSGLLARKGGAKPAMRPQGYNSGLSGAGLSSGGFGGSLEDLGWNDMGPADEYHHPSAASLGLTPPPRSHPHIVDLDSDGSFEQPQASFEQPEASFEQPGASFEQPEASFEQPEDSFEQPEDSFEEPEAFVPPVAAPEPIAPPRVVAQQRALRESFAEADVVALPRRRAAPVDLKAKAAFTLRLDPERHLKLRLASAVTRQSAQQLVTAALDDFLNSLPGLDALADRVPAEAGQRSR
jgi:hypothetical protein